jgi:hypothetical protein
VTPIQKFIIRGYNSELDIWIGLDLYTVEEAKRSYNVFNKYGEIILIISKNIFDGYFYFRTHFGKNMEWFQVLNDNDQIILDSLNIKSEIFKLTCKK